MLTNKQEIIFFSSLGGILLFILVGVFIIGHRVPQDEVATFDTGVPKAIENVSISAKSAFVYDTRTDTALYAKNAEERLPLASLAKVMSALVATDLAPEYSTVTISREATNSEGDSGLLPGERWTLKSLLDFSLVSSANDGMRAVALALGSLTNSTSSSEDIVNDFVRRMNERANSIGMKNTYYFNETGLDEDRSKSGAYGSAKDQAMLIDYILRHNPSLLSATRESAIVIFSLDNISHSARNTDTIIDKIPGVVASKTGYTDLAGGNLIVAFDPEVGRPIIISILGSTETGRFDDMMVLVQASMESVQNSVPLK